MKRLPRWHWVVLGCLTSAVVLLVVRDWLVHDQPRRQLMTTLTYASAVLLFAVLSSLALAFSRPSLWIAAPVYLVGLVLSVVLSVGIDFLFIEPLVLRLLGPPAHTQPRPKVP